MNPADRISNWNIFLWALYQLEGSTQFIDIEDVSLHCFKIAPKRFAWRTKPDLPDYKKCAKALQEAEAIRPRMLVKTRDSFCRQLSAEGQKWIKSNKKRLERIFKSGVTVPEPERRPQSRMLAEIEGSDPYIQWKESGEITNEKWKMADILRCSPDSSQVIWKDRLGSARAVAYSAEKETILSFLDEVAAKHPEWFGG